MLHTNYTVLYLHAGFLKYYFACVDTSFCLKPYLNCLKNTDKYKTELSV